MHRYWLKVGTQFAPGGLPVWTIRVWREQKFCRVQSSSATDTDSQHYIEEQSMYINPLASLGEVPVHEGDGLRDPMSRVGWKKNMESQIQKGTEHFEVQKYNMRRLCIALRGIWGSKRKSSGQVIVENYQSNLWIEREKCMNMKDWYSGLGVHNLVLCTWLFAMWNKGVWGVLIEVERGHGSLMFQ